jgi:creatinine amidohydrolase
MLTWENTWKDIEDSGTTVAVVPIGSTEQHGTNLPLASDSLATSRVAQALAEGLGAYMVPLFPVGTSPEHISFRGTVTLTDDTLRAVVSDVINSLVRTGFTTIIVVSMHGGNYMLWEGFVQSLDKDCSDATIIMADLGHAWKEACRAAGFSTEGMHADETEASMIASLRPELVGSSPTDFPNPREQLKGARLDHTGFPLDVREVSPYGSLGEPSKGSREKGDLFWSSFLKLVVEDVRRQAKL